MKSVNIVAKEDITPICPYCEKELDTIYYKSKGVSIIVGKNCLYFCPHCHKVLGMGQSRMM